MHHSEIQQTEEQLTPTCDMSRRDALRLGLFAAGALFLNTRITNAGAGSPMTDAQMRLAEASSSTNATGARRYGTYPYELPPLPYSYSALERSIDARTMRLHHDRHHKTYVDNLNKAVAQYPALQNRTPQELIETFGRRVMSRLQPLTVVHVNHGKNFRASKGSLW